MDINNLTTRTPLSPISRAELQGLYEKALQIGPSVATYLEKLVVYGQMEQRILDGARALLSLQIAYGSVRLENACKRGLMGSKSNCEVVKNILRNNMDQVCTKGRPTIKKKGNMQDTEYLRGPESFNI
ncbi:hypothetical protein GCM10027566_21970 [Arachidicoccus ginsenosidivorans]